MRYALDVEVVRLAVVGQRYLLDDLLHPLVEVDADVRLVPAGLIPAWRLDSGRGRHGQDAGQQCRQSIQATAARDAHRGANAPVQYHGDDRSTCRRQAL